MTIKTATWELGVAHHWGMNMAVSTRVDDLDYVLRIQRRASA